MTDKVQKIKEWISKTQDGLMDDNGNFENTSNEGAFHILSNLDYYIDSFQEEPEPQFKVGDTICSKVWESAVHEIVHMDDSAYYFENGGKVEIANQELWELTEEPVSEDLEKVAEEAAVAAFFVSPQWTKTGERLFKAGAEWGKNQAKVEIQAQSMALAHGCPKKQVSEDSKKELPKVWDRETLDEYAYQVAYDLSNDWMRETATWDDVETAVKLGAKWQKERKENG